MLAYVIFERGPAAGNLSQALNPELPRGLAILAPKDKKKAPRLIALLEFTDGRAVIPYTLQGHYDLYILIPGYLPLLHKDVNIGAQDQEVTINPVSAGSSKTVPLGLSPDWDPLKESTLQVPPCPPCDEEEDGTRFLIRHTGSFTSKGAMYNVETSAGTEFSLVLPEGETEAEIDVVYSVQHQLQINSGGSVRIVSISPQSYTLNAVLRWRVQKTTNRDGVDEYEFGAEIIDRETAQIRVVTQDRGDEPVEWNMEGAGNAIDLCFPRTWFQVRQGKDIDEFPFYEKNEFSDSMPRALIGMSQTRPDAPRSDDSDNKTKNTVQVEISGKKRN